MTTSDPLTVPRRAYRDTDQQLVGGVAAGLAAHLGLPVTWLRTGFVVAALVGGVGLAMYAALWLVLPRPPAEALAPGLAGATRDGRRPGRIQQWRDHGSVVALLAICVGLLLVVEIVVGRGAIYWPVLLTVGGVALLWRQADEAQRERALDTAGGLGLVRLVFGTGGWASYARVAAGVSLIATAVVLFSLRSGSLSQAADITVAVGLAILGVAIVAGPWVVRLATDLSDERSERVRTQERADVAAHLHDSVLQTLALIQKNAADAALVARLARAQERDLRSWLYGEDTRQDTSVAAALRGMAATVEDVHAIAVNLVAVGDLPMEQRLQPLVRATGEAVTNAAKHAGTDRVDVFVEVTPRLVEVFVRDRGVGFDADQVSEDRHGIRHSIVDRMRRHHGDAIIKSAPGEGTEVHLWLPCEEDVDE